MSSACPVFAFTVRLIPHDGSDSDSWQGLVREWREFVRDRGLDSRSRTDGHFDFVVTGEATQASDADRVAVRGWLRQRSDLAHWTVGELFDLQE